jgi:outer membrane biosynthesis protein TonB
MKERTRNGKGPLTEFERYIRGEMTKREENAFQRKLQRDPFAGEATEGFSEISSRESTEDMNRLEKKLKERIKPARRVLYYRIAASVAVLMVISSVFVIVERNRSFRQLSENTLTPPAPAKADTIQMNEPLIAESKSEAVVQQAVTEPEIADKPANAPKPAEKVIAASADTTKFLAMAKEKEAAKYVTADEVAAPAAASRMAEVSGMNASGRKMQIEPDSTVQDRTETVLVGYGMAKKTDAKAEHTSFMAPQPVTGTNNFERYIEENIRRPQTLAQGERVVAIVSFLVRSTGAIDSLKVLESPGDEFAAEAMRLIREGPAWKPAEENSVPVDSEVRLRIIFK